MHIGSRVAMVDYCTSLHKWWCCILPVNLDKWSGFNWLHWSRYRLNKLKATDHDFSKRWVGCSIDHIIENYRELAFHEDTPYIIPHVDCHVWVVAITLHSHIICTIITHLFHTICLHSSRHSKASLLQYLLLYPLSKNLKAEMKKIK